MEKRLLFFKRLVLCEHADALTFERGVSLKVTSWLSVARSRHDEQTHNNTTRKDLQRKRGCALDGVWASIYLDREDAYNLE
eukprot:5439552-Amphidinium_carterae.1